MNCFDVLFHRPGGGAAAGDRLGRLLDLMIHHSLAHLSGRTLPLRHSGVVELSFCSRGLAMLNSLFMGNGLCAAGMHMYIDTLVFNHPWLCIMNATS
jgi:hypothetical protein